MLAFEGDPPLDGYGDPYTVDHHDFDRANNHLHNLRYMTAEENSRRHRKHEEESLCAVLIPERPAGPA